MKSVDMEYLEHGKFFRNNQVPSDFYELAYTAGMSRFSKDLRDGIGLNLNTSFSEKPGNISFAFVPVLGRSRYAFVQFQSRFENEFGGSSTNRPFFQTKFLLYDVSGWRSLYEAGLSVLPTLTQQQGGVSDLLENFSSVSGNIGKSKSVKIADSDNNNNLFFRYSLDRNNKNLRWVSAVADAVLEYKDVGGVNIKYDAPLYDKLMLVDAVLYTLLPLIQEPISFALDSACTMKVDLRFGENVQNRGTAHSLDFSGNNWLQTESDVNELVDFFANNTENWTNLYNSIDSKYPRVKSLREKKKEKDALLFLVCLPKKNYAKLFLKTAGLYDDEIVPIMSQDDYSIVLQYGNDDTRSRLLTNLVSQNLQVNNWFRLLQIALKPPSIPLSPARLKSIVSQYLENNAVRFDDVYAYFGNLESKDVSLYTLDDSQNIFYDLIKRFSRSKVKLLEKSTVVSVANESDTSIQQETYRIKHILNGIKNLPSGYDQAEEMWFWVDNLFRNLYEQNNSVVDSLKQLSLKVDNYPFLFYKALIELQVHLEKISKLDAQWIRAFAKKGFPEFVKIKDSLDNYYLESKETVRDFTETSTLPGYVNVLDQALREDELRNRKPNVDKPINKSVKKKDSPALSSVKKKPFEGYGQQRSESKNMPDQVLDKKSFLDEELNSESFWQLSIFLISMCLMLMAFLWIADWLIRLHEFW